MSAQGGCHLRWSKCFFFFFKPRFWFCNRSPLDAAGEPWPGAPYRLPCPSKTSHVQLAHHLQGEDNLFYGFNTLLKWKKVAKRELNGRRLQEVKLSDCFQWTLFILLKCFSYSLSEIPLLVCKRVLPWKVRLNLCLDIPTKVCKDELQKIKIVYFSSYVLGGTHMTNPAMLVGRILKELTATEDIFYGWDIILFL